MTLTLGVDTLQQPPSLRPSDFDASLVTKALSAAPVRFGASAHLGDWVENIRLSRDELEIVVRRDAVWAKGDGVSGDDVGGRFEAALRSPILRAYLRLDPKTIRAGSRSMTVARDRVCAATFPCLSLPRLSPVRDGEIPGRYEIASADDTSINVTLREAWCGSKSPKSIVFRKVGGRASTDALRDGSIDMTTYTGLDPALTGDIDVHVFSAPLPLLLYFQTGGAWFNQAGELSREIDRLELLVGIESVTPSTHLGVFGHRSHQPPWQGNLASGERGGSARGRGALELIYADYYPNGMIADRLAGQLTRIVGVEVRAVAVPFEELNRRERQRTYDFLLNIWFPEYPHPSAFAIPWMSGMPRAVNAGFSSARYDAAVNQALLTDSDEAWLLVDRLLGTLVPQIPIGCVSAFWAQRTSVPLLKVGRDGLPDWHING